MCNKCLKVAVNELKSDPALASGERGARKIIVTKIYKDKEKESDTQIWTAPLPGQECQVLRMSNTEMAFFNQQAEQDRHYHKESTEIYMVIEGTLIIEVEGKTYDLKQGDTMIVHPFSIHEVKTKNDPFLCRVITLNCRGEEDKFKV